MFEDEIRQLNEAKSEAMRVNNIAEVQHYQDCLNKLYSERIDQRNQMVNKMWAIDPNELTAGPGHVITTNTTGPLSGYGNVVKWTNYSDLADGSIKQAQEIDRVRNIKIYAHFAKLFCEKFPNWSVQPDPKDPFKKLDLVHKNNKYRITNGYPDNELIMHGAPSEFKDKATRFSLRHGIPPSIFETKAPTVSPQELYGWALGMDDVPDFIKE